MWNVFGIWAMEGNIKLTLSIDSLKELKNYLQPANTNSVSGHDNDSTTSTRICNVG